MYRCLFTSRGSSRSRRSATDTYRHCQLKMAMHAPAHLESVAPQKSWQQPLTSRTFKRQHLHSLEKLFPALSVTVVEYHCLL